MKEICVAQGIAENSMLYHDAVLLAYLHDIGYAESLNLGDFHATDGFLAILSGELNVDVNMNVALAVLNHTYSNILITMVDYNGDKMQVYEGYKKLYRLLAEQLQEPYVQNLTYMISLADMQVNGKGAEVSMDERIKDVAVRYGQHSPLTAHLEIVRDILLTQQNDWNCARSE